MDLLTAVLVMCVKAGDGPFVCDMRVRKHIPNNTVEQCETALAKTGEDVKAKTLANPKWATNPLDFSYKAKCFTDAVALKVIPTISQRFNEMNTDYQITYYEK